MFFSSGNAGHVIHGLNKMVKTENFRSIEMVNRRLGGFFFLFIILHIDLVVTIGLNINSARKMLQEVYILVILSFIFHKKQEHVKKNLYVVFHILYKSLNHSMQESKYKSYDKYLLV